MTRITERRNCSGILGDIVGSISSKLSFFNILRLRIVCPSRQVAARNFSKHKRLPVLLVHKKPNTSLLIHEDGRKLNRRSIDLLDENDSNVSLYSINGGRMHQLTNIKCGISTDDRLIGSDPDGWLVMLQDTPPRKAYLLKLMPRIQIVNLPQSSFFLFSYPLPPKSVLLSNQDELLVIVTSISGLAIWRQGHDEWTFLEGYGYSDIAFDNKTRTLYGLKIEDRFDLVSVETWDFSTIDFCLPRKKLSIQVSCLSGCYYDTTRIVVHPMTGEIYVLAYGKTHEDDLNLKWLVLKVDLSKNICRQVDSLNGEALFLGRTSSIFVSSNDVQHHGYNPNSIYFGNWFESSSGSKLRNYSLKDAQVQLLWDYPGLVGFSWIELSV